MSIKIVVSDAIKKRVSGFSQERFSAFQAGAASVAKGRLRGKRVHVSPATGREIYLLDCGQFNLYYSLLKGDMSTLVFEEFLSAGEEDLVMDLFAEGSD